VSVSLSDLLGIVLPEAQLRFQQTHEYIRKQYDAGEPRLTNQNLFVQFLPWFLSFKVSCGFMRRIVCSKGRF
jgi:hypothetical protein